VVGPHYYDRRDISFTPERKQELQRKLEDSAPDRIGGIPVASTDAIDGRRFLLASGSWLLTRFSGTEPLLRIYAEAQSPEMVGQLLDGAESFLGL
jgi:phosphomannomutase